MKRLMFSLLESSCAWVEKKRQTPGDHRAQDGRREVDGQVTRLISMWDYQYPPSVGTFFWDQNQKHLNTSRNL